MTRITRPIDVPGPALRNEMSVTQPANDPVPEAAHGLARVVTEITNRARDQQIENQVRTSTLQLRERLDQARIQVEQDPDYTTMPQRWDEAASEINDELSDGIGSPMAQRLWREAADPVLSEHRRFTLERTQLRGVEAARAGLVETIGAAQRAMIDPNASEDTRGAAYQTIEAAITNAAVRGTVARDDAARMLEGARNARAEFQASEGLRAQAMGEEDRIWAESGGDYATALEMVRDIDSPALRDAVEDRIATRHSREEEGASETLESAMERAYTQIEQAGSLDRLSAEDRRVITNAGHMDTLRNYIRARATPGGRAASDEASSDMRYMLESLNVPGSTVYFASIDLDRPLDEQRAARLQSYGIPVEAGRSLRSYMTPQDHGRIAQAQRVARGEETVGESAETLPMRVGRMMNNYAKTRGAALLQGSNSRDRAELERRLEAYLLREAEDFVQSRNREPNQQEMEQIVSLALQNARNGRHVFQFAGAGEDDRRRVRVPFSLIPVWQRERIAREIGASGVDFEHMTEAQMIGLVEDRYMQEISR